MITVYMYLFISYQVIQGQPKVWYIVHEHNREKLESHLRESYTKEFKQCRRYHSHKTIFLDPLVVASWNIPVFKIIQGPGDIVLTWPGSYHWGWNMGLNLSMAVNYRPKVS